MPTAFVDRGTKKARSLKVRAGGSNVEKQNTPLCPSTLIIFRETHDAIVVLRLPEMCNIVLDVGKIDIASIACVWRSVRF